MKTIVITGVTSGIGRSLFNFFISRGEYVIGLGRNKEKLDQLEKESMANNLKTFQLIQVDLASLHEVEDASNKIISLLPEGIDVLINNAAVVSQKKVITNDHFEMQFQVNHLAVVKMTHSLLPLLILKKGIVITTSSNAHTRFGFNKKNLQSLRPYFIFKSYARTKLYNILFTRGLNDYLYEKTGVFAYAVHPGLVKTDIASKHSSKLVAFVFNFLARNGITPDEAVLSYDYLVYSHKWDGSFYYTKGLPAPISKAARNDCFKEILWNETNHLLNLSFLDNK